MSKTYSAFIFQWYSYPQIWLSTHLTHKDLTPWALGLTDWGWVTHICVSKLTIIGSDNGLSPGRRQAIIWTNAGILLIRPLGTNFNEMLIIILIFSFMKMRLKVSSAKWRPFCLSLNVLKMPDGVMNDHHLNSARWYQAIIWTIAELSSVELFRKHQREWDEYVNDFTKYIFRP